MTETGRDGAAAELLRAVGVQEGETVDVPAPNERRPDVEPAPPRAVARSIRVRVRWGDDALLSDETLAPGVPLHLDLAAPTLTARSSAAPELAWFSEGALEIVAPDGARLAHRDAHGSTRSIDANADGVARMRLGPSETAVLTRGAVHVEVSTDEPETLPRPRLRPSLAVAVPMLLALSVVAVVSMPRSRPGSRAGGSELPDLDDRLVAALVRDRALHPTHAPAVRSPVLLLAPPSTPRVAPISDATRTSPAPLPAASAPEPTSPRPRPSSADAAPETEPPEPSAQSTPPSPEEEAQQAAFEERERTLRRMRRQVSRLGDCYEELGLNPASGTPASESDRARLAECIARRQRLSEAAEAGPATPHAVLEYDVVVQGRTGTAVYEGARIVVPLAH